MKEDLRNDLRLKLEEAYGRETLRGLGRSMQVTGEAISGRKVKWGHLGTGIKMAGEHAARGLGRMVHRNPVKSLVGSAILGGALAYGGMKMTEKPTTSPRMSQGVPFGIGGIDEFGRRTPFNFNRIVIVREHLSSRIDMALMEGSRGKQRRERLGASKTYNGDMQARDRAAIRTERRKAGLDPRILPPSAVQTGVLKNGKFRVMSEPYAIDKYGNKIGRGEIPHRAAARVPKAVLRYRAAADALAARGRARK